MDLTPIQAVDECIARLQQYKQAITPSGHIIKVKAGDDLQKAHDSSALGDTLLVDPGVYTGLLVSKSINIVPNATLPATRVQKDQDGLITLIGKDQFTEPLIVTGNGVGVIGIQPHPINKDRTLITLLGDNIIIDRSVISGDHNNGQRRGIAANGSNIVIKKCHIDDIFHVADAQAICSWNGSGPFVIDDCFLSASGETVLFGGGDPENQGKQPSDLLLIDSVLTKDVNWIGNGNAVVKNVLEFKNMINAKVFNCVIENSWTHGQVGYLIVITPRNQDNTAPYSQVAHIEIAKCNIRNGAGGINLLGADYTHPSMQTTDVKILDNHFNNLGRYPGSNKLFEFSGSPACKNVVIHNNTCNNSLLSSFLYMSGDKMEDFTFTNNVVPEGEYGVMSANGAPGISSWNKQVASGTFSGNHIKAGGHRVIDYGPNNVVIP